jgi:Sigma-70, region 4
VDQTSERFLDEYLVLLSQAGSTDALDGLARRWTPRLLRYAARRWKSTSGASDIDVEEIASVLGVPDGTVKSRLHHARQALKRHLSAVKSEVVVYGRFVLSNV